MAVGHYKFKGWLGHNKTADRKIGLGIVPVHKLMVPSESNMEQEEFEPKAWSKVDVDSDVKCCGIYASDIHILCSGWGPTEGTLCMYL